MTRSSASTLRPLLGFSALWWLLAGGVAGSWILGAPAILVAVAARRALARQQPPRPRIRLVGLARFLGHFGGQSVASGWDVARRALSPRPRVRPGFVVHPLALPAGAPRELFVAGVSLLPGTLATLRVGASLTVQVLDRDAPVERELAELERRVADVFGVARRPETQPDEDEEAHD